MAKSKGCVDIDLEKCKGCGLCVSVCPVNSLNLADGVNGKGYHYSVSVNDQCTGCTKCAVICPDGVISVYRQKKAREIVE